MARDRLDSAEALQDFEKKGLVCAWELDHHGPRRSGRVCQRTLRHPERAQTPGKADRHIMQGRARVEAQKVRIASMQERGYDTSLAEDFLRILVTTFTSHRELILQALGQGSR
jgi:hypothetical protein